MGKGLRQEAPEQTRETAKKFGVLRTSSVGEKRLLIEFDTIDKNKGQPRVKRKTDSKTLT